MNVKKMYVFLSMATHRVKHCWSYDQKFCCIFLILF